MALIEVRGLVKGFGRVKALDGLNLTVPEGSIYGFIGPNGAGKTTAIKVLAALLAADEGEVRLAGVDARAHPREVRALVGYLPDFFGVYDDLTVREYLDFYGAAHGLAPEKRAARMEELLALLGLEELAASFVDTLSRGQKQRLGLARALIHQPRVLLLDEPASGLDPRARVELRQSLLRLREGGTTILFSSHILSELGEVSSHVGIVQGGVMLAEGPVAEVLNRAGGVRRLEIKVLRGLEEALALLPTLPGVLAVRRAPTGVALEADLQGSEIEAAGVLAALTAHGVLVAEFRQQGSSLEEAFLKVTGEVHEA